MAAKITFLDDSEDLRVMVSNILSIRLGVDCITVSDMNDLLLHSDEILESELVILDINLSSNESGLDAYKWLMYQGFKGKIFFLTGYDRTNPLVEEAYQQGADVYQKPLGTNQLLSLVNQAIEPGGRH